MTSHDGVLARRAPAAHEPNAERPERLIDVLRRLDRRRPLTVEQVTPGFSGMAAYRVGTPRHGDVHVKLIVVPADLAEKRRGLRREWRANRRAACAGLAPPPMPPLSPDALVTAFVQGVSMAAGLARDPAAVAAALRVLRRLHALEPTAADRQRRASLPAATLHDLVADLVDRGELGPEGAADLLRERDDVTAQLRRLAAAEPDVLVHGDFQPRNILLADDGAWLIDFADVGVGHPTLDLAHLAVDASLPADEEPALLRAYDPARVAAWGPILRATMHLWHLDRWCAWQLWQHQAELADQAPAMRGWHAAELARCRAERAAALAATAAALGPHAANTV